MTRAINIYDTAFPPYGIDVPRSERAFSSGKIIFIESMSQMKFVYLLISTAALYNIVYAMTAVMLYRGIITEAVYKRQALLLL